MPKIILTAHAHAAVRAAATQRFRDTSVRLPDGTHEVDLHPSTIARLEELRFPSESLSDVVERVCGTFGRALS